MKKQKPLKECGFSIPTPGYKKEYVNMAFEVLYRNLKKYIPKGYVYELRAKIPLLLTYNHNFGIAWYYHPSMQNKELVDHKDKWVNEGSHYLIGRYRV